LNNQTEAQYRKQLASCREIFSRKNQDYGTSWRILRLPSLTDQIFIKAQRIRSIEEKGSQKVGDSVKSEFQGIINYCLMALIQLEQDSGKKSELDDKEILERYDDWAERTLQLLLAKNHDYGEAWREMRVSSFTDIILMRLFRIKQIEDNGGTTIASEGVDANYMDMINYSVFALIKLETT